MMHCIRCKEAAPQELTLPRFCFNCGYPMAQFSPYREPAEENLIPLRDTDDRPLALCPISNGLLVACTVCGRLCQPSETVCPTIDEHGRPCGGAFVEPLPAFPSERGAIDGTRVALWSGLFSDKIGTPAQCDTDPLQAVAFRYGLLVGVTAQTLVVYERDGGGWKQRGTNVPLGGAGQQVTELLLDDGRAYVTLASRTLVFNLSTLTAEPERAEKCRLIRRGGPWLVRVVEGIGGKARLIARQVGSADAAGPERAFDQPYEAESVFDMAVGETTAIVATHDAGLIRFDLATGQSERLPVAQAGWRQVACRDGTVVALGLGADGPVLTAVDEQRRAVLGTANLARECLLAFAWRGKKIYIPTRDAIAEFDAAQITRNPVMMPLAAGLETEPSLLALVASDEDTRLLLRRRISGGSGSICQVVLVNPKTTHMMPLGHFEAPRIAIADGRIVVAARDGQASRLRTYRMETPAT